MITELEAIEAGEFHIGHSRGPCAIWHRNGETRNNRGGMFHVPVRHESGQVRDISRRDASDFHTPGTCPRRLFAAGDGATLHYLRDSHAYTVIKVSPSGRIVTMQRDIAVPDPDWKPDFHPGGFLGHTSNLQDLVYTYRPDPDGVIRTARLNTRGWESSGQRVGHGRHEFYDSNL